MTPPPPAATGTLRWAQGIPLELLVGVARAAGAPVVLETPGDAAGHAEEITLLREALG